MTGRILAGCLTAATVVLLGTLALGQTTALSLTIHGEGQGCGDDARFCYSVEEGNLADLEPGATVTLTFENNDTAPHNVYVAPLHEADPHRATTRPEAAIASTPDIASGQNARIEFTAPVDTTGLYFWCEVGQHENLGMYLEAPYEPTAWDPPNPRPTPTFNLLVFAISLALASLLGQRGERAPRAWRPRI